MCVDTSSRRSRRILHTARATCAARSGNPVHLDIPRTTRSEPAPLQFQAKPEVPQGLPPGRGIVGIFLHHRGAHLHSLRLHAHQQPPGAALGATGGKVVGNQPQSLAALASARKQLDEAGVAYAHHVAIGHVADTIVRYARERGFDRIVMGSHGRTGLLHLLMGSVAREVSQRSTVPVTLVKPDEAGR